MPVLVIAIVLGLWAIALVLALVALLAAPRSSASSKSAGYPSLALFGTALAVAIVLDAGGAPLGDKGLLLVALGVVLVGVGAFTPAGSARRPGDLVRHRLRRAVRRRSSASSSGWQRWRPPIPDTAALAAVGAERGWILLLVLGVWAYDTGAYLVGQPDRTRTSSSSTSRRRRRSRASSAALVATTVVGLLMLAALGQPPLGGLILGPLLGLAAQAGDLAESMLKRAAGAKDSGTLIPGPRRDPRPDRLVPVRRPRS